MNKLLFTILAGCTALTPTTALADPFSIGAAVLSGVLSTTGVALAISPTLIGGLVLGAANIGLSVAQGLLGRQGGSVDPGQVKQTFQGGEDTSEIRVIGRARVGGLRLFGRTSGVYTYRLLALARGQIDGIEEYFVGGSTVVINPQTFVCESFPWRRAAAGAFLRIEFKPGTGNETAFPILTSRFPGKWTTAHRARGVAQILAEFRSPTLAAPDELYMTIYGSGGVRDDLQFVIRGERVWDPRDTSQSQTNPSSWKWEENGILAALHLLRLDAGIPSDLLDIDQIKAEANKAEVMVQKRGGTRARAVAWGAFLSESDRSTPLSDLLKSIGAEIRWNEDAKLGIYFIEDNPPAELSIPIEHNVSENVSLGPEAVARPNVCRVRYYSENRNFELAEIPLLADNGVTEIGWSRVPAEIAKYGEQVLDIDLPFCPDSGQAQQIARRIFAESRAMTGVHTFNFAGVAIFNKRVIEIGLTDMGVGGDELRIKVFVENVEINDDEGLVTVQWRQVPTLDTWAPLTHEAVDIPKVTESATNQGLATPVPPSNGALNQLGDGSWQVSCEFTNVADAANAECVYRAINNGIRTPWRFMSESIVNEVAVVASPDLTGHTLEFKVRFRSADDDLSAFSAIHSVDV